MSYPSDIAIAMSPALVNRCRRLADERRCTIDDVLDAIIEVLEYKPALIWRKEDAVGLDINAPELFNSHRQKTSHHLDKILEFLEDSDRHVSSIAGHLGLCDQTTHIHLNRLLAMDKIDKYRDPTTAHRGGRCRMLYRLKRCSPVGFADASRTPRKK
jgi:DNA-binding MarR family transcriptional regulator